MSSLFLKGCIHFCEMTYNVYILGKSIGYVVVSTTGNGDTGENGVHRICVLP